MLVKLPLTSFLKPQMSRSSYHDQSRAPKYKYKDLNDTAVLNYGTVPATAKNPIKPNSHRTDNPPIFVN